MKLAFYKANQSKADWQDKLIAWWTNGVYSHVELVHGEYMYSCSPRDGKVRRKKHQYNSELWDYVEVEGNEGTLDLFFGLTEGASYDWFAIAGFIIPLRDREDKFICSEWCTTFLKTCGDMRFVEIDPARVSPNRLYEIVTKG